MATATKTRAKSGPAAAATGTTATETNARRFRWVTMPPIEGFSLEHDAGNSYRIAGADGKRRIVTGSQMARVLDELRSPGSGKAGTAAAARSGSRSSGSKSRNAGK